MLTSVSERVEKCPSYVYKIKKEKIKKFSGDRNAITLSNLEKSGVEPVNFNKLSVVL